MKRLIARLMLCLWSGVAYGNGAELFKQGAVLFESDPAQAFPLFVQAAEEGHVPAMVGAGHCLENGEGTEVDYAKAIEWYEQAVSQNNLKACEGLARIYASCPNPQFHDGEKAVKYAGAVVRKKSKDAEALSLLAAAYARNMEFGKATKTGAQAQFYAGEKGFKAKLLRVLNQYKQGRPYPPEVTDEWLKKAAETGASAWAEKRMLCRFCERTDPYYSPETGMKICQRLVDSGQPDIYLQMSYLYLDENNLEAAHKCLDSLCEYYERHDMWNQMPGELTVRYYLLQNSAESAFELAKKYMTGFSDVTKRYCSPDCPGCSDCQITNINNQKRSLRTAYFLFRIAAYKGHSEAQEKVKEFDNNMGAYLRILENKDKSGREATAKALADEAVKFETGSHLPKKGLLALEIYHEAYKLNPLSNYADEIGNLSHRYVDMAEAITWWERAADVGNISACKSLIQCYACANDSALWDAEQALKYAQLLVGTRESNDHEAQSLLACAYARSGDFTAASKIMEKVLDASTDSKAEIRRLYEMQFKSFKRGKPWITKEI